jgi:hypothetical protein
MVDRRLIGHGDRSDLGGAEGDDEVRPLALAIHGSQVIRRLPGSGQTMVAHDVRTVARNKSVKHRAASKQRDQPAKRVTCRPGALGDGRAVCDRPADIESMCSGTNSGLTLAERHCDHSRKFACYLRAPPIKYR